MTCPFLATDWAAGVKPQCAGVGLEVAALPFFARDYTPWPFPVCIFCYLIFFNLDSTRVVAICLSLRFFV